MTQLHRVQLLIEEEQRAALAEIAARERSSVSDVVREVIRLGLEQREQRQEGWRDALDRPKTIRQCARTFTSATCWQKRAMSVWLN